MTEVQLNSDLIADLAERRVVLFLGSGVSASATTNSGARIKQWKPFLEHCATFLDPQASRDLVNGLLKENDFLLACEVLRRGLADRWRDLLHQEFAQKATPSALHEGVLELDQRIIVTTNFDKLVEAAIERAGGSHYPQVITRLAPDAFRMLRDNARYLVKLHGTIDDPDSFIFTKSEYISRAFESWVYGEFLRTVLATHTVLFIGFSMADPAVSALVEQYAFRFPDGRPHYILQSGPVAPELIEISKSLRKLYIIEYDPHDDHIEAVTIVKAMAEQMRKKRAELAASVSR